MSMDSLYLLSVDIGTTHVKTILYLHGKGIIAKEEEQYDTYYPQLGWVELDQEEIFQATLQVIQRLMKKSPIPPRSVAGIVFTGILQSIIPVDREGRALSRASTWADTRSFLQNEKLKTRLDAEVVKQRTGCTLHPMYFLSRLIWIQDEMPDTFQKTALFISIKEYILFRLFGVYRIDYSIASGTGIWNMHTRDWDADLLAEIDLRPNRFSECIEPTAILPAGLKREIC